MEIPRFETQRLILRAPTLEDAPSYQKHFNDFQIIGHLAPHVPWPYPHDGADHFLRDLVIPKLGNEYWMWGIFLKSQPSELIGAVDVYRSSAVDNRGFWLGRKFWGQGLMPEALEPVTDFAFRELGFTELKLSNALGNTNSRRIKEKQGAKLIGTRKAQFVNPAYTEAEDWILTKEDWLQRSR